MEASQIKERRKALGMSQADLAKKVGVSVGTILNYEHGKPIPESKIPILESVLASPGTKNNLQSKSIDDMMLYILGNLEYIRAQLDELKESQSQILSNTANIFKVTNKQS